MQKLTLILEQYAMHGIAGEQKSPEDNTYTREAETAGGKH